MKTIRSVHTCTDSLHQKFKAQYFLKISLIVLLVTIANHALAEHEEILVVKEKANTSRVLWGIYDVFEDKGNPAYRIKRKTEFDNTHNAFEVIGQAEFERRFGIIDIEFFRSAFHTNGSSKKPLVAAELFSFTDIHGIEWAVLDMVPYDTVEKLHHVHPEIERIVADIRRIEAAGGLACITRQKNTSDRSIQVVAQHEIFQKIPHDTRLSIRWENIHRRLVLLQNQMIRPGMFDAKVLIKGMSTFSGILLWSTMHPIATNQVPVEQALSAALVGGLWAGFIVYHSQTFRNIFAKPNGPLTTFTRSFIHSVLFGFIITSFKTWNFDALNLAVWTHLSFHAIKSTWAKFKWKGLIKKIQDRSHSKNGVIKQARTHDFVFELIYDFLKTIDLLDVNDQKHTEGRSPGGEILFFGGILGIYAYYAYEMLYDEALMTRLKKGSHNRKILITKFIAHSTYIVPAMFIREVWAGVSNSITSVIRRLTPQCATD